MTHDPITGEVHVSDLERRQDCEDERADQWNDQQVDREEWRKE